MPSNPAISASNAKWIGSGSTPFLETLISATGSTDKIKRGLLTFEDLPKRLPKTAVPLIFRDMDPKELLAALKSGQEIEPDTVEFLFANISQRMAEQYKEQVEDLGALSGKEVDAAIIALMSFISRREKSGAIIYIDIEEPES